MLILRSIIVLVIVLDDENGAGTEAKDGGIGATGGTGSVSMIISVILLVCELLFLLMIRNIIKITMTITTKPVIKAIPKILLFVVLLLSIITLEVTVLFIVVVLTATLSLLFLFVVIIGPDGFCGSFSITKCLLTNGPILVVRATTAQSPIIIHEHGQQFGHY